MPNWRTVSPEFFSWVRTRRLLSYHTCPVRSPSLCVQGKLSFSTFLTKNEGTTDESKKRLGCYQQFNLPREYSVFDSSQYIVNNGKFKMRRRQESQISNRLTRQEKALHVHHTSLPSTARLPVKMPNQSCFVKNVNKQWQNSFSSWTWNSAPEEFACIWQSKWVGIITIETEKMWVHSSCDVFVVVSCRGILNSLIFTKAWSMQAWIPVVSSSLYFWKSVFSFRADSILKSDGDFISNWKFPDCVHFFGAWARQAVIEKITVVYELTKRT